MWRVLANNSSFPLRITVKTAFYRGSEFLSYEIELQNRVKQNYVTLRVTNSRILKEIFELLTRLCKILNLTFIFLLSSY